MLDTIEPMPGSGPTLLLCLSHLRWDFVVQRPQHLMTRAAGRYQVLFWEEPEYEQGRAAPGLRRRDGGGGVTVVTPLLGFGLDAAAVEAAQRSLLDDLLARLARPVGIAWFYTPMALPFAGHVAAETVVYDCMDELTKFEGASPRLLLLERRLLRLAHLVFTGGRSLHNAKQHLHADVHCFPSAVDSAHFAAARHSTMAEPADQAGIPHPRIGFFGVLDERLDTALLAAIAERRPDWQFVLIGPVAKIDADDLPRAPNLHWLGSKQYSALPGYLAGWDAGIMPFALNDATQFISPTKTPEFLAAGLPVVSTPIADVIADWGRPGLVEIACDVGEAVSLLTVVLQRPREDWLARVDRTLAAISWDATWLGIQTMIEARLQSPVAAAPRPAGTREAGEQHT